MSSQQENDALPTVNDPVSGDSSRRPRVIVFDVNETLSDMSPMAARFEDVGAPAHLAKSWFAGLLRDGFALTVVNASDSFARIGSEALRVILHGMDLTRELEQAVEHVMEGFGMLEVHPDVPEAVRVLSDLGIRLVTLSNGSTSVAEGLLERAGIRDRFERLMSVEDAGLWKPASTAYTYAVEQCGVEPAEAMLVAVHPWDTDGASRAGLASAWVNRSGGRYPDYFSRPDVEAASMQELAIQLR